MCDFGLLAFETAPVGIVLAENRVIRSCNKTFANMLGYHVENLVGQSFRMLYGSDDEFEHVRDVGLTHLKKNEIYEDERMVRHHDGHSLWCWFRAQALYADNPLARVVMSFTQNLDATSIRLTKRERQVLGMMNQRMSSKEIAVELCLSPRTVDDVRARLIKRFGLRRATDLLGKMRNLG